MKLAILLLCHKNAKQINLFLKTLKHPDIEFFIHMDKKANIIGQLIKRPDIHVLSDNLRVDVRWGEFSQTRATLNLFLAARKIKNFDYYWVCSGQDFPIVSADKIINYFKEHPQRNFVSLWPSYFYNNRNRKNHYDKRNDLFFPRILMGRSFIKRLFKRIYIEITGRWDHTYTLFLRSKPFSQLKFFYGPSWVCLSDYFVNWMFDYLKEYPSFIEYLFNSLNPDESIFQTLLMASPYKNTRHDYLHYVDWTSRDGKIPNSPNTLTIADYDAMKNSGYLMARKFDMNVSKEIIGKLINSF